MPSYDEGNWFVVAKYKDNIAFNLSIVKKQEIPKTDDCIILFGYLKKAIAKECCYYFYKLSSTSELSDIVEHKRSGNYFRRLDRHAALFLVADICQWSKNLQVAINQIGKTIKLQEAKSLYHGFPIKVMHGIGSDETLNPEQYCTDFQKFDYLLPKIGFLKITVGGVHYENLSMHSEKTLCFAILALHAAHNTCSPNKSFVFNKHDISYHYHPDPNAWKNKLTAGDLNRYYGNDLNYYHDIDIRSDGLSFKERLVISLQLISNECGPAQLDFEYEASRHKYIF